MGFFTLEKSDIEAYATEFTEWIRTHHGGTPRRRLKPGDDKKVLISDRNPISRATSPIGYAWIELSEDRDFVQGYYQHYYEWEVLELYRPLMAGAALSRFEQEERARTERAEKNDPMRKDHHANSNVIREKGKE